MFCRNCGTQNADGAPTCISCGAPLDQPNPYQSTLAGASQPMGSHPSGPKPKNYLIEAILVTLCCCLPLGIVGIVYAAQVDSKWNAGDFQGANAYANSAKNWVLIGLVMGLIVNFGYLLLQFAVIGAGAAAGGGGF